MKEEIQSLIEQVSQKKAFLVETEKKIKSIEVEARDFQGGAEKQKKVEAEIQKHKKALASLHPQLANKSNAGLRVGSLP